MARTCGSFGFKATLRTTRCRRSLIHFLPPLLFLQFFFITWCFQSSSVVMRRKNMHLESSIVMNASIWASAVYPSNIQKQLQRNGGTFCVFYHWRPNHPNFQNSLPRPPGIVVTVSCNFGEVGYNSQLDFSTVTETLVISAFPQEIDWKDCFTDMPGIQKDCQENLLVSPCQPYVLPGPTCNFLRILSFQMLRNSRNR